MGQFSASITTAERPKTASTIALGQMAKNVTYKVIFFNHGKVYELFSKGATASGLYGFVEISDLVFTEGEGVVIDPTEDKMRDEFAGTKVLHIPMHSIIRIEEVEERGACVIRDRESGEKITPFPLTPQSRN